MAPARRRAAAKNGASAKDPSPEPPAEVSLPRRSASARSGAASSAAQKKQAPTSRAKASAADDSESELSELDEDQEEDLEAQLDDEHENEDEQGAGPSGAAGQHDGPLVQLQFSEPLAWRPGRPIPTEELIRRLQTLSQELTDLDQESFDTESLAKVAKELANQNLLGHKDKGVKAYAAACLVDILCLCAPNAPFTEKQLKDVFALFIASILPALQDPSNTYDAQHKYVLHSLGEVRSILLLNDLDNSDSLQLQLFTSLFDAVSAPKNVSGGRLPTDVEHDITEVLICLIEEGATIPPKVVDVIMAQFLRAAPPGALRGKGLPDKDELDRYQSTLLLKEEPPAYQMAKLICLTCADKMTRSVAQYFSDVIIDFSGVGGGKKAGGKDSDDEGEEDEGQSGPSETDLREMKKAHLLLRELWRAAPQVLSNVVPQLEAELSADNVYLRQLASETLGDMIAGIGAAGPPPFPALDPAAYPPPRLSDEPPARASDSVLTTPTSPHSFAQTHPHVYQSFINRKNDKSALIRTAWVTAAGYILSTSAGGIGLSREEETVLVFGLGDKLNDSDEKVRLAAVKAIECFSFRDVITKLAPHGGVTKQGSVLSNLADRCRDRKSHVRVEAMALLGKLWAAATGELAAGDEAVIAALSAVPSRIFSTIYANDLELNLLVDRIAYEYLVPLSYPAVKKAQKAAANGRGQQQKSAAAVGGLDADALRAERILLLVRSLDASAKRAFFALQSRQPQFSKVVDGFLKQSEAYNGGVGEDGKKVAPSLEKSIQYLCQFFPDAPKVRSDLQRFAKMNDRRSYQLVRFVTGPEYDFTTMYRAMKELVKKIQATNASSILDTLLPLLYRSGCIMFNRSHLTTIMEFSKAGHEDMAATANEMLKEVSQRNPGLFKTTIGELCKELASQAPTESRDNDPIVIDSLKACSSYAAKYPQEVPRERKFVQAWISFAVYGRPEKAAKYAVNILLATKDEKSMVSATELAQKVTADFNPASPRFLNKLVAVSQLARYAPSVISDSEDELRKQAMSILRTAASKPAAGSAAEWVDDANFDDEGRAKVLSLNLLVQQLLGTKDPEDAKADAKNIIAYLIKIIVQDGETRKTEQDTPESHKARLRLAAAQAILKVCANRHFDEVLSHADFNKLALVTQDKQPQVRRGFIEKLQKYLVLGKLRPRFYTIIFLAAFEPVADFKNQIETWIRSRARHFQDAKQHVLEGVIARLISLLAHHPDYRYDADDLVDHARYIVCFLSNVATEANLGLINKYAERVKQTFDGIDPAGHSENLYVLSDLTQATIRKFQQRKGWTFEPYADKVGLPQGLYSPLPSHEKALEIARKQFLPEGVEDRLEDLLKASERKKKRRSATDDYHLQHDAGSHSHAAKKAKTGSSSGGGASSSSRLAAGGGGGGKSSSSGSAARRSSGSSAPRPKSGGSARKPSKPKASPVPRIPDSERRRSGRSGGRAQSSYIERDSDEDDEEMLDGVAEWQYVDSDDDEDGTKQRRRRRSSGGGAQKRGSRGGGGDGEGGGIWGRSMRQASDSEADGDGDGDGDGGGGGGGDGAESDAMDDDDE